jgi:hypothetical protein
MDSNPPSDAARRPRSRVRRVAKIAVWLVYMALLVEATCRCYWKVAYDVPPTDMAQIFDRRFYPELHKSGALETSIRRDDEHFNVLMLGGSVVAPVYATIDEKLRKELSTITGRSVRVFNCAGPGLTSRDSLLKYRALEKQEFDLVLFYHGINDARMNNCPREQFRDDYTHGSWYARIEALRQHGELHSYVTPYTIDYLTIGVRDSRWFGRYLPRNAPPDGRWFDHGLDVKTGPAFEANVREVLELAKARKAAVLLPTFVLFMPADYESTDKATRAKQYRMGDGLVELWGNPEGVRKAVGVHNNVLRKLANEHDHVTLVEMDGCASGDPVHFLDVCHLTDAGTTCWIDRLRPTLATLPAKRFGAETVVAEKAGTKNVK